MTSPKSRNASPATISRSASYMPIRKQFSRNNSSSSSLRMISRTYTWIIHDFTCQTSNNKKILKSPPFPTGTANDITWRLRLHPNGDDEQSRGYLSLFLYLEASNSLEVDASCEFAIIDVAGKRTNIATTRRHYKCENGCRSVPWGYKKYVSVAALTTARSKLLPNDALTIQCDVMVFKETVEAAWQSATITRCDKAACTLSDDLAVLYGNKQFSDVLFSVSGETFYAHKAVLTARSPAFAAMFRRAAGEDEPRPQTVDLSDARKDVFAEILRYVYTGKAPNLASFPSELLAAANEYELARLKTMCEARLGESLTTENAADILTLAELHDARQLKERTKHFIVNRMEEVKSTDGFKKLAESQASLMIEVVSALSKRIKTRVSTESSSFFYNGTE